MDSSIEKRINKTIRGRAAPNGLESIAKIEKKTEIKHRNRLLCFPTLLIIKKIEKKEKKEKRTYFLPESHVTLSTQMGCIKKNKDVMNETKKITSIL